MKIKMSALLLITAVIFSACSYQIPDLTDEQSELVAEYAAAKLLSHDANYHNKLISPENAVLPEEKPERAPHVRPIKLAQKPDSAAEEAATKPEQNQDDSAPAKPELQYSEIGEFLGYDQLKLEYSGVSTEEAYPNIEEHPDAIGVQARAGNTLAIYHFMLNNTGTQSVSLDMAAKDLGVYLSVNDGRITGAMNTLLPDDFTMFKGEVGAGSVMPVVLITEIPADLSLDSAVLRVFDADDRNANMFLY